MKMDQKNIISPCISVCKTDPLSGYCYGCGRTNDEKKIWKDENTTNEWKSNNLVQLKERLSSWQQKAFEKSYQFFVFGYNSSLFGSCDIAVWPMKISVFDSICSLGQILKNRKVSKVYPLGVYIL